MHKDPKFSENTVTVAIPCFNAAKYLGRVLESVKDLSTKPKEVVVIDDGSKDNSGKIAASHGIKVIQHSTNQGLGSARQTALRTCETAWLAMIDSDVAVEQAWLSELLLTAARTGAAGVGGDLIESEARTIPDRWRARMMAQTHGGAEKVGVNLFGCNTLHSVEALKAVGGFNPRYNRAYEDIDISERLIKAGHKLVYTPSARCHHLRHDSITSVLQAAFSWRLPRYEDQGVYEEIRTLMGKWVASFKEDFRELQMLLEESNGELSFPALVQLFANPIQDLSIVATNAKSMRIRGVAGIGTAIILLVLKQAIVSEELKQAVALQLKPFIDSHTRLLERIAIPSEGSEELQRMVLATVTPWSTVIAFSPEHTKRLHNSAKLSNS